MVRVGQVYRARNGKGIGAAGAIVRVIRTVSTNGTPWIGAVRWIASKGRFSSGGFGSSPEDFLKRYELQSDDLPPGRRVTP